MPVFVNRSKTPFNGGGNKPPPTPARKKIGEEELRTPQARVLAALIPDNSDEHYSSWPLLTRASLAVRAGYTPISGSITRALNGIREGSSSGDPHPGLIARGLVKEVVLDIDGLSEVSYHITQDGIVAYQAHVARYGAPKEVKNAQVCTNNRYKKGDSA